MLLMNPSQMNTVKLPPEVQLQAHFRNMLSLLREGARNGQGLSVTTNPTGRRGGEIRAKALALAMSEASAQFANGSSIEEPELQISPA